MANPYRGEVEWKVGGKTYTVCFDTNAVCNIEAELGKSIIEISNELMDPERRRVSTMRAVFLGAMRRNHKDLTLEEVGDLMSAHGLAKSVEVLSKAIEAGFQQPEAGQEPSKNPPKGRRAGTG